MTLNRREFIKTTGACVGGAAAALSGPKVSFAGPVNGKKLVYLVCPGGIDGFTLIPPVGDNAYYTYREVLAVPRPGDANADPTRRALYMSDLFGMHPRTPELYGMFQRGELTAFPNVVMSGSGSHFSGQRPLHNGMNITSDAHGSLTGWVNRLLTVLQGEAAPGAIAVTGAPVSPDTLSGPEVTAVYAPPGVAPSEQTITRLRQTMGARTLRNVLNTGIQRRDAMNAALNGSNVNFGMFSNFWGVHVQAQIAGLLLGSNQQYAPSVAVLSMDGWDWHTYENFGWGYPAARLAHLSQALGVLVQTLKDHNIFQDTLIMVVSEFGRPVSHNGVAGSGNPCGTDHGIGQAGLVITGNPQLMSLPGQGVVLNGAWPGFASRTSGNQIAHNGRYQNIMREYVRAHFGLNTAEIDFVLPYLAN